MKTFLLIMLQLGASGADAYFTNRNQQGPHAYELNPIARPFLKTTPSRVLYFSSGAALKITVPVLLRKRHHDRLALTFSLAGIADNGAAAAYSAAH